ncbi:polycystin-1-like protein 2 [Saccoglossus kowalevskii]
MESSKRSFCIASSQYLSVWVAVNVVLTVIAPPTTGNSCDENKVEFRSSCLEFVTHEKRFGDAELYCADLGGHLIFVTDQETQEFVVNAATNVQAEFDEWWIGLTDRETEGVFRWLDGSELVYEYFQDNEPNSRGAQNKDCVLVQKHDEYKWNDLSCNTKSRFICQYANSVRNMNCQDCGQSCTKLCNGDTQLCKRCKNVRFPPPLPPNQSKMADSKNEAGDSKLDEIQATLLTLTAKMDKLNRVEDKLEDMRKCVEYVSNFFDGLNEQLCDMRRENDDLREQLAKSNNETNELQQYTRRNNLEIAGIIEEENENTDDIVVKVAAAAGVTISPNDIDISHRLPRRSNSRNHQPTSIIVKFVRRTIRNELYKSKKHLKNRSACNIEFASNNRIYINENLTPTNKQIFFEANQRRNEKRWKFIWTTNGKIYTRKEAGHPAIRIAKLGDIDTEETPCMISDIPVVGYPPGTAEIYVSFDQYNDELYYRVDFGDEQVTDLLSEQESITHDYQPGSYTISVLVSYDGQLYNELCQQDVSVEELTVTNSEGEVVSDATVGDTLTFTAPVQSSLGTSFRWQIFFMGELKNDTEGSNTFKYTIDDVGVYLISVGVFSTWDETFTDTILLTSYEAVGSLYLINNGPVVVGEQVILILFTTDVGTMATYLLHIGNDTYELSLPEITEGLPEDVLSANNLPFDPLETYAVMYEYTSDSIGHISVVAHASNPVSDVTTTSNVFVVSQSCDLPTVQIQDITNTTQLTTYKRGVGFTLNTDVVINCDGPNQAIFEWTLHQVDSEGTTPDASNLYRIPETIDSTQTTLVIPASMLDYGIYVFKLTVSIVDVNTMEIVVYNSDQTYIEIIQSALVARISGGSAKVYGKICLQNCDEKMNPSKRLVLSAHCSDCTTLSKITYKWELLYEDGTLTNIDLDAMTSTGIFGKNLAINVDVFTNTDESYKLKLSGTVIGREEGFSEYAVIVNSPPSPGTCTVSPISGYLLETIFTLNCQGFSDDDLPLMYEFSVITGGEKRATINSLDHKAGSLLYYGNDPYRPSIYLPLGLAQNNYTIDIVVRVSDVYGATVQVTTHARVMEPETDSDAVGEKVVDLTMAEDSALESMMKAGDMQRATQLIGTVSSWLNAQSTNNTKQKEEDKRQNTEVRTVLVKTLSLMPVESLEMLQQTSDAINMATQEKDEVSEDAQAQAASAYDKMGSFLKSVSSSTGGEVVETVARTIMSGLSNIIGASLVSSEIQDDINNATDDDNKETNSQSLNAGRRNVTLSLLTTLENIQSAILVNKVSGEKPTVLKTDLLAVTLNRQEVESLNNAVFQDEDTDGGFILPDYSALSKSLPENYSDAIDTQLLHMLNNPFTWDPSSKNVQKGIMGLQLKTSSDQTIQVTDLTADIEFFLPQTTRQIPSQSFTMDVSNDTRAVLDFNITSLFESAVIGVKSNTPGITFRLHLSFNIPASLGESDSNTSLPRIIQQDDTEFNALPDENTWFLSSSDLSGLGTYYVTIVPQGAALEENVTFDVYTYTTECQYWDEDVYKWLAHGCRAGRLTTPSLTHCLCNHLTVFGSSLFVMPNTVDFIKDAALFLTFVDNPVVVSTVATIFVIYLFIAVWAYRKDRHDAAQAGVTVLEDNDPYALYRYDITVHTGFRRGAGTTANVTVTLYGENQESEPHVLADKNKKILQRGTTDSFLMTTNESLGSLKSIRLWHDNVGSDPEWFVGHIMVHDLETDERWYFLCNTWLAVDIDDGLVDKFFNTATDHDLKQFNHLFVAKTAKDLRDRHLWFSIIGCPAHSHFTRLQRLSCCLSMLLCTMLANIMFYGIPEDPNSQKMDFGVFAFSWQQLIIGVQSGIIVLPINIIIVQTFRYARRKPKKQSSHSTDTQVPEHLDVEDVSIDMLSDEEVSILMSDDFEFSSSSSLEVASKKESNETFASYHSSASMTELNVGYKEYIILKFQQLNEELIEKRDSGKFESEEEYEKAKKNLWTMRNMISTHSEVLEGIKNKTRECSCSFWLPWWFVYVGWFLVFCTSVVSAYFVMLYGLSYGKQKSIDWLISMFISLFESIFVDQPLNVLFVAVFVALFLKSMDVDDDGSEEVDEIPVNVGKCTWSVNVGKCTLPVNVGECTWSVNVDDWNKLHHRHEEIEKLRSENEKYFPPTQELVHQSKEAKIRVKKMYALMREIFGYIFFIWLLLIIAHAQRDKSAYFMTKSVKDIFFNNKNYEWGKSNIVTKQQGKSNNVTKQWGKSNNVTKQQGKSNNVIKQQGKSNNVTKQQGKSNNVTKQQGKSNNVTKQQGKSNNVTKQRGKSNNATKQHGKSNNVTKQRGKSNNVTKQQGKSNNVTKQHGKSNNANNATKQQGKSNSILKQQGQSNNVTKQQGKSNSILQQQGQSNNVTKQLGKSNNVTKQRGKSNNATKQHGKSNIVTKQQGQSNNLHDYSTFFNWTSDRLMPGLYGDYPGFISDDVTRLVGGARIRQIRSKPDSCSTPLEMRLAIPQCNSSYLVDSEDTTSYSESWQLLLGNQTINATSTDPWEFQESVSNPYWGQAATYSGDGYVCVLDGNETVALDTIQYVEDALWLDSHTRALFVEFTLYNANSNLFSIITLLIERPDIGGLLKSYEVLTVSLFRYAADFQLFVMSCEIAYIGAILFFSVIQIIRMVQLRKKYFMCAWNWLELTIIIVSIVTIGIYIQRELVTNETLKKHQETPNSFVSFHECALLVQTFESIIALLVVLGTVKFLHLLRINPKVYLLTAVLASSGREMAIFTLMLMVIFTGFACMAYIVVGPVVATFRNIAVTYETIFSIMLGYVDNELRRVSPWFAAFLSISFVTIAVFFVLNIFISLLITTLKRVRRTHKPSKDEVIVEMMISKIMSICMKPKRGKN